ncbi:MFS transporter [Corynebacterium guangdongense]|uniref:MFS transporter n=1 Tax=Corynebacterium guangdongense TaxID=1783348 RepID=A0ABU2A0A5_9CORY|nr:MFS transporter [Corynebacterium guangdongense]MDR7330520.1 putative MFS transporter [Corynebacterium guangdongense]
MSTPATPTTDPGPAGLTRNERLDRLPVTAKHHKLLVGSGIGWALDAMDVGLISFIMAALAVQWSLSPTETSWIASVGFIGMALGATFGGLLADRVGRRQVFAITLLVYGIATGASAFSTGLAVLIALRFIVGLGLGAELPVASTLISEFAPRKIRGRMVVLLEAWWAVGWILAAVIGTFVVAGSDNGWRYGLLLGTVPAAYALIIRWKMPESVRFLETKGRHEEAEATVRRFESGVDPDTLRLIDARIARTEEHVEPVDRDLAQETSIWSRKLRGRTAAFWIVWFCVSLSYYGAFTWIPSLLVADGFTMIRSFSFTLIITLAQLPGYAVAAWLIEKWGRRMTLAVFLVGSAVSAGLYGLASVEWQILAAGMLLSFFNLGAWGALYAIGPELYPAHIRATGTGAAAGFGRIASILAPLIVPFVMGGFGISWLFALFATSFAIAAVAAFTLPEQKGRQLDA